MNGIGELKIVQKNWNTENETAEGKIEYPIYEANYISAVRSIFHSAFNQKTWEKANEKRIFKNELKNIIAFIGERGSGKTTAMDEFCRILQCMDREENKRWWLNYALQREDSEKLYEKTFKFYIVSPVDASLLSEKDDLFELILVNIYKEFERDLQTGMTYQSEDIEKVNDVVKLFQEIFEMYHISQESKMEKLHAAYALINYITGSYEIQGKVADLVDRLLKLKRVRYDFEYVVIAIDDLDLNLTYGYQMLELLQKYFSYYKIVILTAVDYRQMNLVCEKHFRDKLEDSAVVFHSGNEYNRKLANDYMTKIFPFSQRIYMPDIKKLARNICVLVKDKDGRSIEVPVKKYIMQKIARKMRIYYDACGLKWHFCELETIRELASYDEFLNLLIPVAFDQLVYEPAADETQKKVNLQILKEYDHNHEQFNRDIAMRLTQNMLTRGQKDIFTELNKRDLERRASYFVSLQKEEEYTEMGNPVLFMGAISEDKYAYGDVLERIYTWGRKYFVLKPLISCIMASFTSEMVREYLNYRYNPHTDSREMSKKRLYGFLGESFGNSWCGAAFPKINIIVNNEAVKVGYGFARRISQGLIRVDISMRYLKNIGCLSDEKEIRTGISKWITEEKIVETLECLDLFFVKKIKENYEGLTYTGEVIFNERKPKTAMDSAEGRIAENAEKAENEIGSGDAEIFEDEKIYEEEGEYLRVTGSGSYVTLDVMSFVIKSLDYKAHKQKIQKNIIDMLTQILTDHVIATNEEEKMIRDQVIQVVKERSLFTEDTREEFYSEIAFPFYDLDLSYNIWKRVRRYFENKVYRKNNIILVMQVFLRHIESLLKNEEEFYQTDSSTVFAYRKNFSECPYVKAFRRQDIDGIVDKRLSKALRTLMINQAEPEDADE